MQVGIYGDSHAACIYDRSINDDISYVEMLYHKYNITNFGVGGSSLFYSYQEFLNTHTAYDKIIFLSTNPGRFYLNKEEHTSIEPHHLHVTTGISQIEHLIEYYQDDPKNAKVFQIIRDYVIYVQNNFQENILHDLMLQDIKRKRPDAFLIETGKFGGGRDTDFSFWNLDQFELNVYSNFQDFRHCHFSKEKHIILYEMIEENIKTGKDIDYSKLINVKPSKTFEDYFKSNKKNWQIVPVERYKEVFK